jgi:MFS family permease
MIVNFVQGLYFIWGFYATQPYFLDLLGKPEAVWVAGVVAALVSISMIAGSWLVDRFMSRFRLRTTILIISSGLLTVSTVGVGLADSFWLAVPLFLLGTLAFGIIVPVKQAYLHQVAPSAQRATVISFASMMDSGGGVVGQTGLGYLSRQQGIAAGFVTGGAATLLAIPLLLILRRLGDHANHINPDRDYRRAAIRERGEEVQGYATVTAIEPAESDQGNTAAVVDYLCGKCS